MRAADFSGCTEFRRSHRYSRRDALRLGGVAGLSVTLPMLFEQRAQAAIPNQPTFGRAKQVICLFLHGGHPQQETFDPKPNGPAEVRGEFGAIPTSLPGVQFSEMLPRMARIAHRLRAQYMGLGPPTSEKIGLTRDQLLCRARFALEIY